MPLSADEMERLILERIEPQVKREAEALKAALQASDDVSLPLLQFHLLAEQMLERIIAGRLKRAEQLLESGRLSFSQKLMLVQAFDVVEDGCISAMQRVNSLRNAFAHVPGRQLEAADIDRIGQDLGDAYQEIKRVRGDNLKIQLTFTLARVAQPFIKAVLVPEAIAHLAAELDAMDVPSTRH